MFKVESSNSIHFVGKIDELLEYLLFLSQKYSKVKDIGGTRFYH